jgi:hypothetical protein
VNASKWTAICSNANPYFLRNNRFLRRCIGWLLALALTAGAAAAPSQGPLRLNPDAPDTYIVQAGDTLWDISALFLSDPWRWPDLWQGNPHLDNPHLIYPGDQLDLFWADGVPYVARAAQHEVKLSPAMRASPLALAIPPIPRDEIEPFLRQHRVVETSLIEGASYILAGDSGRLLSGLGDRVYAKGRWDGARRFRLVRTLDTLYDPQTGESLGVLVVDVGEVMMEQVDPASLTEDDAAKLRVTEMRSEIRIGDRLLPVVDTIVDPAFQPKAPAITIDDATMIAVPGGVTQIGVLDIVVLNRGERESLQVGDVLVIDQAGQLAKDPVTGKPVLLPEVRAGVLIVFSVFERASFGLVLEATRPLSVGDTLRNP